VGCERLADPKASRADFEWQCLVAAMLSSQTKDQTNAEAMAALKEHGNTISTIASTSEEKLDELIAKVGFHRVKAKNIREAARLCLSRHDARVPSTLEGMLALPGVGPKMAYLTLHAAFGKQEGLCIDTHIHRIANVLGWICTRNPEQTRLAIEAWLPREYWPDFNVEMVGFGQMQQQLSVKLIERCLASSQPTLALKLVSRVGLVLKVGKFPLLDDAAKDDHMVKRLLK